MVDYLERQQEQKRKEQQKSMRDELQKLIEETKWEQKIITEEYIHHFKIGTLKSRSGLYSTYAKYMLGKSLDHCNSETSLNKIVSTFAQAMEGKLQKLSTSLATMKTLLDKDYIGKEEFDNCQAEAETDRVAGNVEEKMWQAYRDMCLSKLLDIDKKAMYYSDPEFTTGK